MILFAKRIQFRLRKFVLEPMRLCCGLDEVTALLQTSLVQRGTEYAHTKVQLISKCLFAVFNSSKKRTFALAYWGRNFSFGFWKNLKNQNVLSKLTGLYRGFHGCTYDLCKNLLGRHLSIILCELSIRPRRKFMMQGPR